MQKRHIRLRHFLAPLLDASLFKPKILRNSTKELFWLLIGIHLTFVPFDCFKSTANN